MLTGSLAVLQVAAKYREQFLLGIYQIGARQIEKGTTEAPVAYLIPPTQHDPPAAALFVETLMRGAVEVQRAEGPFSADGTLYPAGTWVVRMDQPFRPFAKDLLEPQRYPDLRSSPGGSPLPPYDTAGWTLAYQMGVNAVAVSAPFTRQAHAACRLPPPRGSRRAAARAPCRIRPRARPWPAPWPTQACRRLARGPMPSSHAPMRRSGWSTACWPLASRSPVRRAFWPEMRLAWRPDPFS